MPKDKSLISKIKKVLNGEAIELAEFALEDGTMLVAELLEPGESVFIKQGEENIPLPVGEYLLADGRTVVVTEEGVIAEVMAAVEAELEKEEVTEDLTKEITKKVDELNGTIDTLSKENATLKLSVKSIKLSKGIQPSPEGKDGGRIITLSKRDLARLSTKERINHAMQLTPFYRKPVKLATTTSITTTYAGEFAGEYIRAATLQGVTLGSGAITVKENIKYKEPVKRVSAVDILADATCDFTPVGTVTLDERIIEPKSIQVNLELCKKDFQSDWDAISMGYSAFDVLPPTFQAFFAETLAAVTNEAVEISVWNGDKGNAGEFDGFITKMAADSDVIDVTALTITAANVIEELGKVADAIPQSIYNTEDITIYISANIARAYIRALGGFGTAGLGASGYLGQGTVGDKPLNFDGIPLFLANGLPANRMVGAQARNLWYGTGLMSDQNTVQILDMADIDGSQNVRFILRFTGDTQYGYGTEVVLYSA